MLSFSGIVFTFCDIHSLATLEVDIFFVLGIILIAGYIGMRISRRLGGPDVVAFLLMGVLIGRSCLNLIDAKVYHKVEILSVFALVMVGFSIGGELRYEAIRELGKTIPIITICESLAAFIAVGLGIFWVTKNLPLALLFGAISSATAPAATVSVLWQYRARGPLTTTIFSVVGLDDAAALIIYAFASTYARVLLEGSEKLSLLNMLKFPFIEIVGSLLTGTVIAIILHYVLRQIRGRDDLLIVTLGALLLCAGVARVFKLSAILASMALGCVLINISRKNKAAFDRMSQFNHPFILTLFVIVGSHVEIGILKNLGIIGLVYIIMRGLGKFIGAWAGASVSGAKPQVRNYLGFGLMSQAGVAIGLAIEISNSIAHIGPEGTKLAGIIMNTIAATVFVFEVIGPNLTKYAIFKAGEAREKI